MITIPESHIQESHNTVLKKLLDAVCDSIWVFGYGSIMWKTGFQYSEKKTGYIKGYGRRFWQKSETHRGTKSKPGRVATLVEDPESITWGEAFHIVGREHVRSALEHLGARECSIGGYTASFVQFQPSDLSSDGFEALTFYATPENHLFTGEEEVEHLAISVFEAVGASGHNIEYVLKTAEHIREKMPHAEDDHLFPLADRILELCSTMRLDAQEVIEAFRPDDDWTLTSAKHLGSSLYPSVRRNSWRA